VIADAKSNSRSVIDAIQQQQATNMDMVSSVGEYMEHRGIEGVRSNYTSIDRQTGVESSYSRYLDSSSTQYSQDGLFSEKQIQASRSFDVEVTASIESLSVEDLDSEIEVVSDEIKQAKEELDNLDRQYEQKVEQIKNRPLATPPVQEQQQQQQQQQEKEPRIEQQGSAMGHLAASISKYMANKTAKSQIGKPISSAFEKPTQKQNASSIAMQCQEIKDTVNNLCNPNICKTQDDAQKLSDSLNERLVKLNQTMTQATKKVFNSTGDAKEVGAKKLQAELDHVTEALDTMNAKMPEISNVMDKFKVTIDMAKVQSSLAELTSQLKDALKAVIAPKQSPSMSMGT
jgi:archaellum component FlaC